MRALWEQVPLIQRAKASGATVIAVDEDNDADGLAVAEEAEIVPSLRNLDACLEVATEYDVDAIVTDECDYSAFTVAYIGEQLSLPTIGLPAAQSTTNKKRLRRAVTGDVPQPDFEICATVEEASNTAENVGYPIVVKPVDNRGAFGVSRVPSPDTLRESFLSALANSHAREVIVEQFVSGTPITVEGYYIDGTHRTLLIGRKNSPLGNLDPQREIVYPAGFRPAIEETIHEINDHVASTLGDFGATHAEYILTDNGECYLVEFHNRGGGIHISAKVVPEITGFDMTQQLLTDAFDFESGQEHERFELDGAVVIHPFILPSGTVTKLCGEDDVRDHPGVLTFQRYFDLGETIERPDSPTLAHGLIVARGETHEAANHVIDQAYELLTPVYEDEQLDGKD
jgi:biotin carboxylase